MRTLAQSARELEAGASSRSLVEECLARIADPAGEGSRVFLKVHADSARAAADHMDGLRRRRAAPSRFAGIPISVKDLFDVAGDVTMSGSVALRDAPPAAADAVAVARLRAAGLIPIGRTNMTEFAFTGLGINPHYDTPRNPFDRATGRIPGGSSSGAAVSVTDGMAVGALGTDTGGSCRIPAALCGIVGYKPTARRIPLGGVLPLSLSLDSVGPLAPTVACCAALDAIMAGEDARRRRTFSAAGIAARGAPGGGARRPRPNGGAELCGGAVGAERGGRRDYRYRAARSSRRSRRSIGVAALRRRKPMPGTAG